MLLKFPKNFLWGGAMSAEQTEGKGITQKGKTIYDKQFEINPKDFFDEIGPNIAIDTTRKYKEDILLMKKYKINSHRTSFSWARLFPEGDFNKPNKAAVKFYHDFIDEFHKNHIELIVTLFHFDMPLIEQDIGGWESREVWNHFLEYAKFVFGEYGSKIQRWVTINEPWVPAYTQYFSKMHYPKKGNEQSGINACYGIVMGHAMVVNYFNENIKDKFHSKIGAIFNSSVVYPKNKNNPNDVKAAMYASLYQFTGVTDAMILGKWDSKFIEWTKEMNLVPNNYMEGDFKILAKVKIDWIGLNFYAPMRVQEGNKNTNSKIKKYFSRYNMPNRRENKFRGWEIYPEALYDTFEILYKRYGQQYEYMLTEFGMGVENENVFRDKTTGLIVDNYRIAFFKEHLHQLHRFIQNYNAKVIGAHVWATFDCWSWTNAFKNRYGLFEVNLQTQERKPKASIQFMKKLIENNGFDNKYEKIEKYMDYSKLKFSRSKKIE